MLVASGLGLVIGGAAGNLVDRLRGGTVTDFLYLHRGKFSWPVFNVADIAVSCGALLLFFAWWSAANRSSDNAAR
jgi:signal peptidase II